MRKWGARKESNLQPTDLLSGTKNKWFQRFPASHFGNKWPLTTMVVTSFVTKIFVTTIVTDTRSQNGLN